MSDATFNSTAVVDRLGASLRRYCELLGITPGAAAKRAGSPTRYGWHCAADRACTAEAHLKLSALIGCDPETGRPADAAMPRRRGDISWPFFATGLRGRLLVDRLTVRDAARLAGVSPSTISRATDAQVINLTSFLKLSRFLRRHPNEWTIGPPPFHGERALKQVDAAKELEAAP